MPSCRPSSTNAGTATISLRRSYSVGTRKPSFPAPNAKAYLPNPFQDRKVSSRESQTSAPLPRTPTEQVTLAAGLLWKQLDQVPDRYAPHLTGQIFILDKLIKLGSSYHEFLKKQRKNINVKHVLLKEILHKEMGDLRHVHKYINNFLKPL